MGLRDIIDIIKIKNSGDLDGLGVFDEEKKGLFSEIFKGKAEKLKDKIDSNLDVLNEETETSKRTAEILEGTEFKNKFNEIYDDDIEGQRKFEVFNRKISYVVKSYIDGVLPQYDDSVRVELATGFQFVLMQKMTELGAEDSAAFFANFTGNNSTGLRGIVGGLFKGLKSSSGFVSIGQRLQNFLYFLDEYKSDLGGLEELNAGHIPNILLNDAKSNIWDSWSNIEGKKFDEIKTQVPVFSELNENTETANLKEIANNSSGALNKKMLDALSNEKGSAGALVFAAKFLKFRPKLQSFLAKPIMLATKLFDNSFLGKQFLGGKTVVEYLQDKHNGKTMDLVLGVIGFRGGRKGLNSYLDKDKDKDKEQEEDKKENNQENKTENKTEDNQNNNNENIVFDSTISSDEYLAYGAHQIEKTESALKYDAVNPYDVNGVSLGKFQWHGVLAQKLMQFMQKQNKTEFNKIMGSEFIALMDRGVKDSGNIWRGPKKNTSGWINSQANRENSHPSFLLSFKKLMAKKEFKTYMNLFQEETFKNYIKLAKKNGVNDPAAAVYFARLSNRGPVKAIEFRNKSDKTLAGLHNITQQERKGDVHDPLGRIYNPLFSDLQKTDFTDVDLDQTIA